VHLINHPGYFDFFSSNAHPHYCNHLMVISTKTFAIQNNPWWLNQSFWIYCVGACCLATTKLMPVIVEVKTVLLSAIGINCVIKYFKIVCTGLYMPEHKQYISWADLLYNYHIDYYKLDCKRLLNPLSNEH